MDQAPDQTQDTQAVAPAPAPAPAAVEDAAKKGAAYGSILGIILIVGVLIVGAFYVWEERVNSVEPTMPEEGVRGDTMPLNADGSAGVEVSDPIPQ